MKRNDHKRGNTKAQTTWLEYGDYECPHCGEAYWIIKDIMSRVGKDVCFVYRNFPLTQLHPYAFQAACAAEAAGKQNKFWEMHDILFENQNYLEKDDLYTYAKQIKLNLEVFKQNISSSEIMDTVQNDFTGGIESDVNGTPTFFIDSKRFDGPHDYETLLHTLKNKINQ